MNSVIVPGDAKYTEWLNKHDEELIQYAGQWVAIKLGVGIVCKGTALEVQKEFGRRYPGEVPFIYHVPRPDEGDYVLSCPG